jgi:hypothetical protein
MIKDAEAFWISPRGEVFGFDNSTHIRQVLDYPESFGFSGKDELLAFYEKYHEPIGFEGKARQDIMVSLLSKGWIRIRFVPKQYFYTVEVWKLTKRVKENLWAWAGDILSVSPKKSQAGVTLLESSSGYENREWLLEAVAKGVLIGSSAATEGLLWVDSPFGFLGRV